MPEWLLGILTAIAAVVGIVGSFVYPVMRVRFGVQRTGIIGFSLQLIFNSLCVVSVWLPGSPFGKLPSNKHDSFTSTESSVITQNSWWNVSLVLFMAGIISSRTGIEI